MSITTWFLPLGAALGLAACDRTPPPAPDKPAGSATTSSAEKAGTKQTVRVSGSSALQPLVNAAKEKFETDNRATSVEVSAGGSKKGLSDVAIGAVHIGDSDIFAPADMQGLVDHILVGHLVGFAGNAAIGVAWQIFIIVIVFITSLFTV